MSYRKITVNNLECEYTIGRQYIHIKIPGQKSINVSKFEVDGWEQTCDCCGEPLSAIYDQEPNFNSGVHSPGTIRQIILHHLGVNNA